MPLFLSQDYEVLPVEEKDGNEERDDQADQPTWRKSVLITVILMSLSFLILLLVFVGINLIWTSTRPDTISLAAEPVVDIPKILSGHEIRAPGDQYLLGVGKADITGPVVELNFMGYASLAQVGTGLRQRVYSRAFIIGDVNNATDRFIYLVLDTACGDTAIRYGILDGLAKLGAGYSVYTQNNVAVTGTHSHSGPGAWVNYLLPQITSLGFSKQSYQAIIDGTVLSIKRAHESMAPGYLAYGETTVPDANINRSPSAYLANPAEERAKYSDNVDKAVTVLRFQRASDGLNTGILAWHSVHGTSMLENNTHVTGDNKGLSSYLFEEAMKKDGTAAPGFVAAFSQSSVGDTTPNVLGAWCDDGSGQQCTFEKSTCGGKSEACHGRGPAFQKLDLGVSSCYEIGRRVFQGAKDLYDSFDSRSTAVKDPTVKAYHTFNDMRYYKFPLANGTVVETCPAALGYGFAAGTTDGPGPFDFTQSNNDSNFQNPLWQVVSGFVKTPTPQQKSCQSPKPILLDVGEMDAPYAWSPNIIDVQSLRVGQFIIIVSPSEPTTMTGRRWKSAVALAAKSKSITSSEPKVVLGGPANTYAHYAATREEYGVQRYEGASTLYGQWHSEAFIYLSTSNIGYLKSGSTPKPPPGPSPPNNADKSFSFISPVVYDNPPIGKKFGQVLTQPQATYSIGSIVKASFVAANPRNNLRLEGTYTSIEQLQSDGTWKSVRDDKDWFLVMTWVRDDGLLGSSHVDVSWETAEGGNGSVEKGSYRIRYNGDSKQPITGRISAFTGVSNSFTLS